MLPRDPIAPGKLCKTSGEGQSDAAAGLICVNCQLPSAGVKQPPGKLSTAIGRCQTPARKSTCIKPTRQREAHNYGVPPATIKHMCIQ